MICASLDLKIFMGTIFHVTFMLLNHLRRNLPEWRDKGNLYIFVDQSYSPKQAKDVICFDSSSFYYIFAATMGFMETMASNGPTGPGPLAAGAICPWPCILTGHSADNPATLPVPLCAHSIKANARN